MPSTGRSARQQRARPLGVRAARKALEVLARQGLGLAPLAETLLDEHLAAEGLRSVGAARALAQVAVVPVQRRHPRAVALLGLDQTAQEEGGVAPRDRARKAPALS